MCHQLQGLVSLSHAYPVSQLAWAGLMDLDADKLCLSALIKRFYASKQKKSKAISFETIKVQWGKGHFIEGFPDPKEDVSASSRPAAEISREQMDILGKPGGGE